MYKKSLTLTFSVVVKVHSCSNMMGYTVLHCDHGARTGNSQSTELSYAYVIIANLLIVGLFPTAAAAAAAAAAAVAAVLSSSGQLGSPSVVPSTQQLALVPVGLGSTSSHNTGCAHFALK